MRPEPTEYDPYYTHYINLVNGENLTTALIQSAADSANFWQAIEPDRGDFRYAEDKWSVKQIVSHIIDTERVFNYRALSFARGEQTKLPGYDHDSYAWNSKADSRELESLVGELRTVRAASVELFKSFDQVQLESTGIANNAPISVRAIGFIIVGHELHHSGVIKERYL